MTSDDLEWPTRDMMYDFYRHCCGYDDETSKAKAEEYINMQDWFRRGMEVTNE